MSGSVLTGLAAMAASDGSAAALGVTDPREWTWQDWVADAAPHLAYGVVTHGVVRSMEERDPAVPEPSRASQAPAQVPRQVPLHSAAALSSQEPEHSPVHSPPR